MIAITTIDVLPDYCYQCPCHDGESGYCQADKEQRYSDYRPYWCPLKEIHITEEQKEYAIEADCMYDRERLEWVTTRWQCGCCHAEVQRTDTECWHCRSKLNGEKMKIIKIGV